MIVRLAIKGFDSDSLMGSRSGAVVAAYPIDFKFGSQGENDFFGLAIDLPEDHPLVARLGSPVSAADGAKHRYRLDWTAAGISGATLAVIRDRKQRSPWRPEKLGSLAALRDRDAR